tara:strand:+ start:224 stop:493 length:270 start_codon:yes stop_codon:yes gene_type:complete
MEEKIKNQLTRRLKVIEGQVKGIQKMVEKEEYCVDIITQTSAVRQALSSTEDVLLNNHLSTHVVEQMKGGEHQRAIAEILSVYKLSKKK